MGLLENVMGQTLFILFQAWSRYFFLVFTHGSDFFFLDAIFWAGGRILTKLAAQIHSRECKKSCEDFGDRDLIFKVDGAYWVGHAWYFHNMLPNFEIAFCICMHPYHSNVWNKPVAFPATEAGVWKHHENMSV